MSASCSRRLGGADRLALTELRSPDADILKPLVLPLFKNDPCVPPPCSEFEEPIPDDRYHGIYFAMLLAGVGFLLPYNSFITDVDYLHDKFKGGDSYSLEKPLFTHGSHDVCVCVFQGRL